MQQKTGREGSSSIQADVEMYYTVAPSEVNPAVP